MNNEEFKLNLKNFIKTASKNTYAGGGEYEKIPERPNFYELTYSEGDFSYRDSYTGHYKSRGMEVVRFKGKPIWSSLYGGGMLEGSENISVETFEFLKSALSAKEEGSDSFRGPKSLKNGKWKYEYTQNGDLYEFSGDEKIYFDNKLVFIHKIIGGNIIDKE